MLKVMAECLSTGRPVSTHAVMTPRQFSRLNAPLAIYCPACRRPHLIGPERLWLEGERGGDRPPSGRERGEGRT